MTRLGFARRFTAPISIVLLILVAGVAFATLRTNTTYPDPILDPDFALWAESSGQVRLMIWQLQYVAAPDDLVWLSKTQAGGMNATEIQILKNNPAGWSYVYLSQSMDGQRLAALFTMEIAISIMKNTLVPQATLFGVEVNDGLHVLTFIFSDQAAEPQQFLAHRTVFIQTQANSWVKQQLDFAGQYAAAKWERPNHLTLSAVFGAGPNAVGLQTAYVHGFSISQPKTLGSFVYSIGLFACRPVQ